MRKTAPAILFTTVFALASGSAFALGDRAKDKKATTDRATTTQATENPSGSGASNTTKGMSSTPSSTSAGTVSSAPPVTGNKSQVAQNDARCDESKYASRTAMPKECLDKSGTGASAVGSTQGQSGGSSGPSGAGSSGPAGSSSSSSSASSGGTGK